MSTTQNPQMTEVLVNTTSNRIATQNDLAKFDMVYELNVLLTTAKREGKDPEYLRHMEKHIAAIFDKLGRPAIRKAYVPKQKFVFAE